MRVRASVSADRSPDSFAVVRRGKLFIRNKKNPRLNERQG